MHMTGFSEATSPPDVAEPSLLSPLVERVTDGASGTVVPRKVGDLMNLSIQDLAELTGVHRNSLAGVALSPKAQGKLRDLVRLLAKAAELLGGDAHRAVIWFRFEPLAGFGGDTAEDLYRQGHADAVARHLEMLEDGVYA